MSPFGTMFVAAVAIAGAVSAAYSLLDFQSSDPIRFGCYFLLSVLASGLKVALPTISGALSVSFLFILVGVFELSLSETLAIGLVTTLIQCTWKPRQPVTAVRVVFNLATVVLATLATYAIYHSPRLRGGRMDEALVVLLATAVFFFVNSVSVSAAISVTEGLSVARVWKECYLWAFPYYVAGAGVAALFHFTNRLMSWQTTTMLLPVVYLIYRAYRLYVGRLDDEIKHTGDMASLHLRTIEALALAIDAKDHTTHGHLQRVQVYAAAIGEELDLSDSEMEALRAASVLHDIGKLAVPEHIISKPGRLTAEEFEKMKIHPIVGAEILEQVQFPYPVVPIVRSHHERWDGAGYPDGLRGEEIPIGARILAAIDCLDALAADRQYRRALPLDDAMRVVAEESGKAYDPRVVDVLQRRYRDLEKSAQLQQQGPKLGITNAFQLANRAKPAAGLDTAGAKSVAGKTETADFLALIAAARQEVHGLFELAQDLGTSLSLDETLSVLSVRLKRMVPYDSMAVYVRRDGRLAPVFVTGDNFRLFSTLEIPLGQGLSGWVAENRRPIANGNPSLEPGYVSDPARFTILRSALAVPLEGVDGVAGVLTLYRAEKDAFTRDHLRILLAISGKVALSVENAMKYQQAETSAVTDYLTGLPNARSLFLHLDAEMARCRLTGSPLTVLVGDLDDFKQVNDRFGHLEGNRILTAVGAALRTACRESDYVARMGGDEFVMVLPGLRPDDIPATISRLTTVAGIACVNACGEEICSLSIGAASFPSEGDDAEQLLAEADRRMYKTKLTQKALPKSNRAKSWAVGWTSTTVQ